MKLSWEEVELINKTNFETLAKWYQQLNTWGWPTELLPEEPPHPFLLDSRRSALMRQIEDITGLKYLLRQHNKDMPDKIFEDFWQGHYRRDEEANERYYKWLADNHKI